MMAKHRDGVICGDFSKTWLKTKFKTHRFNQRGSTTLRWSDFSCYWGAPNCSFPVWETTSQVQVTFCVLPKPFLTQQLWMEICIRSQADDEPLGFASQKHSRCSVAQDTQTSKSWEDLQIIWSVCRYYKVLHNLLVMLYFETRNLYFATGFVLDRQPGLE